VSDSLSQLLIAQQQAQAQAQAQQQALQQIAQQQAQPSPGAALWQQAQKQYPMLSQAGVQYVYQPQDVKAEGRLEFYPPGETMRPAGTDVNKPAIAVFDPNITPKDIYADFVSHHLRQYDPTTQTAYQQFVKSITPDQKNELTQEYQHETGNKGEPPPDWMERVGYPSAFRGYLFNQWPENSYSPEQVSSFQKLGNYLGVQRDVTPIAPAAAPTQGLVTVAPQPYKAP